MAAIKTFTATGLRSRNRFLKASVLFWALFLSGLLIEAFAPRLTIQNRAFVMPVNLMQSGRVISPYSLVERERIMQLAAGIFTLCGALGLAFSYRQSMAQALARQGSVHPRGAAKAL
jgi:hypothetical protein